jgi:hypothetical protein
VQRIFFQPLLTQLNLIIIAVKDALRSLTAEDRQAFPCSSSSAKILPARQYHHPGVHTSEYLIAQRWHSSSLSGLLARNSSRGSIDCFFERGIEHRILGHG